MKKRAPLDLALGGESWSGWHFGPYGRCREWRLHCPSGDTYCAEEIAQLHALELNLCYLQQRVAELMARLQIGAVSFPPEEAATLHAAAQIIINALPRVKLRKLAPVLSLAARAK